MAYPGSVLPDARMQGHATRERSMCFRLSGCLALTGTFPCTSLHADARKPQSGEQADENENARKP
jgi:hypothetical protein